MSETTINLDADALLANRVTCMRCKLRGPILLGGGRVPCTVDGVYIDDHATANACPRAFFGADAVVALKVRARSETEKYDGSALWARWHRRALAFNGNAAFERGWIQNVVVKNIPCGKCKQHTLLYLRDHPVDLSSAEAYFAWLNTFHNDVNARVDPPHPQMDLEAARQRWEERP